MKWFIEQILTSVGVDHCLTPTWYAWNVISNFLKSARFSHNLNRFNQRIKRYHPYPSLASPIPCLLLISHHVLQYLSRIHFAKESQRKHKTCTQSTMLSHNLFDLQIRNTVLHILYDETRVPAMNDEGKNLRTVVLGNHIPLTLSQRLELYLFSAGNKEPEKFTQVFVNICQSDACYQ